MRYFFACLGILYSSIAIGQGRFGSADTILLNGNIVTMDERNPRAQALAVKGGRILFVGSNRQATDYTGPRTRVIDLKGATVVPGLTDSHYHLTIVGGEIVYDALSRPPN